MANDSDMDKYLLAKDYLLKRIKEISGAKLREQKDNIAEREMQIYKINQALQDPTLSADLAAQYKGLIQQLQAQVDYINSLNTTASFDDVRETHAWFITKTFKPIVSVAYGYSQTKITPLPIFGSNAKVVIPVNGDFFSDMILYFKISSFSADNAENKVRYCEFPGHRLIREVRFVMDGVVLDRYGTEDINFFYDFYINESQKSGWKRCVGQEVPKKAIFLQDPSHQEIREQKMIFDGYQTLKRTQDEMEIFLPLQFWFCDPKFAMSNYNISYQKTYIEFDLAPVSDIVSIVDYISDGGQFTPPKITDFTLYTNHIYTIPEVADLVSYKNTFNIVRVHKNMTRILNKSYDMVNLNELRFAVENLMIYFRPIENQSNENSFETWNKNNVITYTQVDCPSIVRIANVRTLAYTPMYYYTESPAIDQLGFVSNGSTIYELNSTKFYDSYLPYRFGKNNLMTPSSSGSYIIMFGLYPHEEQPSGYLNLSNSKDNYLSYHSDYIDMQHNVQLMISAKVINFLYLSRGSISMRFAT